MKVIIISYSFTGNNDLLASSVANALGADHLKLIENKTRTMFTISMDILFNRTPPVNQVPSNLHEYELVIFMGPVWMGQVATPLRAYLHHFKSLPSKYAFVCISGGSEGANPKLSDELTRRTGKVPTLLIDKHIADLLPEGSRQDRKENMNYKLTETDIKNLTNSITQSIIKAYDMTVNTENLTSS
jgi:flavodoxin